MKVAAIVAAALLACGDERGVSVVMTVGEAAPAYGEAPFPTDAVRAVGAKKLGRIAGLDGLAGNRGELVVAHVAELDGFGLRPLVEMFVDGALDPASVPVRTAAIGDAAGVVDVDPASPERGRVIAMDWRYDAERGVVAGSPRSGEVLREGTRYAAFVAGLRDASGAAVEPAPRELGRYERWRTTAEALVEVEAARGAVQGITAFTTQRASAPLVAAREVLLTAPPPTLMFPDPAIVFTGRAALDRLLGTAERFTDGPRAGTERWGNSNTTGIAHDHVGAIATGRMTIARFRGDDTGSDLPDDETFQLDDANVPRIVAIDEIPVTFIVPAAPAPPDGYPVAIFGHGLGASRDALLTFAEPLTAAGFAVAGIDMAGHGSRFDARDVAANLASVIPGFTGTAAPDGFGDRTGLSTTFDFFEGFLAVGAVRDSIRQSALDLSRLVQLLRRPDLDLSPMGPGVRLDARHIAYLGESFGTVVGTVFAAIEPHVDLYVLDVPGGGILDVILPNSAEIGTLALPLVGGIYNPRQPLDRWSPLIGVMQAVIDGADPLTYAPHILRDRFTIGGAPLSPRHVIALEVLGDQVLSNRGTDALAQELRLDVLEPRLDGALAGSAPEGLAGAASPAAGNRDGQTAILVQYAPATHGANWASEHGTLRYAPGFPFADGDPFPRLAQPVTIANPLYETLEQVVEILTTHQTGAPPRVRMTRAPIADFDGDGTVDSADPDPLDPSRR